MAHNTIAIVADCDDRLAPDTTIQLLEARGVNAAEFFSKTVAPLVEAGWDPALAYLHKIAELSTKKEIEPLTRDAITDLGRALVFYEGVPACFSSLREEIENDGAFRGYGIRIEFFVISGGIEELIRASPLEDTAQAIWGCSYEYDESGTLLHPKRVISFTDKTRYLFLIQKGKFADDFRNRPYVVNEPMDEDERPIPFRNMIYIGDGPSDIPCMSLVRGQGGYVMGILSKDKPFKTWALGYGRRANITVPPDFKPGGYAFDQLRVALADRATDIKARLSGARPVPGH